MYSIKNNILNFIVFSFLVQVQSLVELRVEDNDIIITEAIIRKTVNGIFSNLNLEDVKSNPRFGEFATIHNFFVTVTLQDHDNLKEIERLVRFDNIDNNTQHFITQVNEVLNEDNKSYEGTDDEYVTAHVEQFIRKLEYLKLKYGFANNDANFDIQTEVLNHLVSGETFENSTETTQETNDTDGTLLNHIEFWKPNVSRRIFEGKRQRIKDFPFMASVQFFKKFQCGGSIIKSDLVITSASCLQLAWNNRFFRENPAFLSVQVGCDLYEAGDENIPVLEVYFHPDYNPKNLRNNLAVMRLVRILKFGKRVKKVKKIDFDRNPASLSSNIPGITIVGWGAKTSTNAIKNIWRNRLSSARLDFYPLKDCQDIYSSQFVDYKNFCGGFISKGGGACNRDAGGPGIVSGKLVGVINFGAPTCGSPDAPTVFTKLGYYTDWIEGIMEMDTPAVLKSTTERTTRKRFNLGDFITYKKSTITHYKISPVVDTEEEATIEETTTEKTATEETATEEIVTDDTLAEDTATKDMPTEPTTTPQLNSLRTLNSDEDKLFKDFISTMFGDDDVKEYLDKFEQDTDDSTEATANATHKPITKATINVVSRSATFKPTQPTTEKETVYFPQVKKGSLRIVTTVKELDELKKITTEQNIARLINNMDVQELFSSLEASEKSSESEENATKPKQIQGQLIEINENTVKLPSESKEESNSGNITRESSSGDNTDDSGDSGDDDHHSDGGTETHTSKPNITNEQVKTVKSSNTVRQSSDGGHLLGPIVNKNAGYKI